LASEAGLEVLAVDRHIVVIVYSTQDNWIVCLSNAAGLVQFKDVSPLVRVLLDLQSGLRFARAANCFQVCTVKLLLVGECLVALDVVVVAAKYANTATRCEILCRLTIVNPATQASKFDPEGDYIRRWLPELRHVNTRDLLSGEIAPMERRG